MLLTPELLDDLAHAISYPDSSSSERVRRAAVQLRSLGEAGSHLADELVVLAEWFDADGAHGVAEERYTQLFDLKAVCTLNVSYHLLGDTYQRGALLAGLAAELNLAEVPHQHDLPDYLPTLLRLLGRLRDEVSRELLLYAIILPGIRKVNEKLEASPGPWPAILRTLPTLLMDEIPRGVEEIPTLHNPLEVVQCST